MEADREIEEALRGVMDPELGISVWDLGLVYKVERKGGKALIEMTFTTPACPLLAHIVSDVEDAVAKVAGIKEVEVRLVWDPPWNPQRISAEGKRKLGLE